MVGDIAQNLLENFDYEDSIEFIRKYGDDALADRLAAMSRSTFTEKKIELELARIAEDHEQREEPTEPISPGSLETLKNQRNEYVRERDHLRGQLEMLPTDEKRLEAALRIVELGKFIYATWQDIHTLESGDRVPVIPDLPELDQVFEGITDVLQLERIRKNYVSYRSKARKGTRSPELLPFYEEVIKKAQLKIYELTNK